MKINNQVTGKILIYILTAMLITVFTPLVFSCKPEPRFGDLVICKEVDLDTFAPVEVKDIFEVDTEKIYSVIEVTDVKAEDVWRFIWKNKDTGEVITDSTGSYSENGSGYMEGYLSNYIVPGEDKGIIGEPGNYEVDFYNNGRFISSSGFIIEPGELEIIGVTLSKEVNEAGYPASESEKYFPDEAVNASVRVNFKTKGESLGVRWYRGEDELLGEKQFTIDEDYYSNSYIVFKITNEDLWPIGDYRVEIFHNDMLDRSCNFEVVRREITDNSFEQKNNYSSEEFKFSINYADDWSYEEEKNDTGLNVSFTPEQDYAAVIIRMTVLKKGYYPDEKEYSDFADNIVQDIIVINEDMEVEKTESTQEINGQSYMRVNYSYLEEDDNSWNIDLIFLNKNSMLYILLKISDSYYNGFADKVYSDMLESLFFK